MPSYHVVAESEHELQNPTTPGKIRLLGDRMRLGTRSNVLDVASGRGGPAIILAETFRCHITCVEKAEEFDAAARRRAHEEGLDQLIEFVHADARDFLAEHEGYDAAMCLGASFNLGRPARDPSGPGSRGSGRWLDRRRRALLAHVAPPREGRTGRG
jgi:cyclopropane fatty-acyl-phospholipid synthase-like methyltransferase